MERADQEQVTFSLPEDTKSRLRAKLDQIYSLFHQTLDHRISLERALSYLEQVQEESVQLHFLQEDLRGKVRQLQVQQEALYHERQVLQFALFPNPRPTEEVEGRLDSGYFYLLQYKSDKLKESECFDLLCSDLDTAARCIRGLIQSGQTLPGPSSPGSDWERYNPPTP